MKWFWQSVGAMLFAIIGGLIVVAFEERVKAAFIPHAIRAEMYPGPWYPLPDGRNLNPEVILEQSGLDSFDLERITSGGRSNFALLEVINRGHQPAKAVRLQILNRSNEAPTFPPHLMIVPDGENPERVFVQNATDVALPDIGPGRTVKIYMWRITDLASPYLLSEYRVISDAGTIPIRLHRYEDQDSREYDEPSWYVLIDDWLPFGLVCFLSLLAMGGIAGAGIYETYLRKILADDSLYLDEKMRFDADPKKFQIKLSTIEKSKS